MDVSIAVPPARAPVSFRDGLGERSPIVESSSGDILEALRLGPALSSNFAVERSLRERVGRLIEFRHASYARIWRVEGEAGSPAGLSLVSERPRGMRLAEMLQGIEEGRFIHDFQAARSLVGQLVSAVASLHRLGRDVAHGTLGPERLVVTPHAQLVVVEHVLGPALEHLDLTRTLLWHDYRVAIPSAAGMPRLDQRADTLQIGVVALALILGRRLREDDFPARLPDLVDEACEPFTGQERPAVSRALGAWLVRALQFDLRHSFQSAIEAHASLDEVLQDEMRPVTVRYVPVAPPASATALADAADSLAGDAVLHETTGRHGEPGRFAGLAPGSFRVAAKPTLSRMGRAVGRVLARAAAILVAVTAVVGLAYIAIHRYRPAWLPDHQPTTFTVESRYPGAEVVVDGKTQGRAPAEIALKPGPHTIELRPAAKARAPQAAAPLGTSTRTTARK